jgi:hypothetical protein
MTGTFASVHALTMLDAAIAGSKFASRRLRQRMDDTAAKILDAARLRDLNTRLLFYVTHFFFFYTRQPRHPHDK